MPDQPPQENEPNETLPPQDPNDLWNQAIEAVRKNIPAPPTSAPVNNPPQIQHPTIKGYQPSINRIFTNTFPARIDSGGSGATYNFTEMCCDNTGVLVEFIDGRHATGKEMSGNETVIRDGTRIVLMKAMEAKDSIYYFFEYCCTECGCAFGGIDCLRITVDPGVEYVEISQAEEDGTPCSYPAEHATAGTIHIFDNGLFWDTTDCEWKIQSLAKGTDWSASYTGPDTPDSPIGTYTLSDTISGSPPATVEVGLCACTACPTLDFATAFCCDTLDVHIAFADGDYDTTITLRDNGGGFAQWGGSFVRSGIQYDIVLDCFMSDSTIYWKAQIADENDGGIINYGAVESTFSTDCCPFIGDYPFAGQTGTFNPSPPPGTITITEDASCEGV